MKKRNPAQPTERVRVHFRTAAEREARWREAAEKQRRSFSDWIQVRLDEAADYELKSKRSA